MGTWHKLGRVAIASMGTWYEVGKQMVSCPFLVVSVRFEFHNLYL